jgi:hypothetical protein
MTPEEQKAYMEKLIRDFKVTNFTLAGVVGLFLIPLLYIVYKVFKMARFNEPLVLTMIVCLILHLLA